MSVRSHTLTPSLEQGHFGRTDVILRPPLHGGFSLETIRLVWLDPATLEGVCGGSDHLRTTASTVQAGRIQSNLSIGLKTKSRHRVWGALVIRTEPDLICLSAASSVGGLYVLMFSLSIVSLLV